MSLHALDTDILSLFQRGHPVVCQHVAAHAPTDLAITVISVEEQLSGWYALLRSPARRDQLAVAYRSLADSIPFLAKFNILAFPETAMDRFERMAALKLNVRKMDLRIAAIALKHGAVAAAWPPGQRVTADSPRKSLVPPALSRRMKGHQARSVFPRRS